MLRQDLGREEERSQKMRLYPQSFTAGVGSVTRDKSGVVRQMETPPLVRQSWQRGCSQGAGGCPGTACGHLGKPS